MPCKQLKYYILVFLVFFGLKVNAEEINLNLSQAEIANYTLSQNIDTEILKAENPGYSHSLTVNVRFTLNMPLRFNFDLTQANYGGSWPKQIIVLRNTDMSGDTRAKLSAPDDLKDGDDISLVLAPGNYELSYYTNTGDFTEEDLGDNLFTFKISTSSANLRTYNTNQIDGSRISQTVSLSSNKSPAIAQLNIEELGYFNLSVDNDITNFNKIRVLLLNSSGRRSFTKIDNSQSDSVVLEPGSYTLVLESIYGTSSTPFPVDLLMHFELGTSSPSKPLAEFDMDADTNKIAFIEDLDTSNMTRDLYVKINKPEGVHTVYAYAYDEIRHKGNRNLVGYDFLGSKDEISKDTYLLVDSTFGMADINGSTAVVRIKNYQGLDKLNLAFVVRRPGEGTSIDNPNVESYSIGSKSREIVSMAVTGAGSGGSAYIPIHVTKPGVIRYVDYYSGSDFYTAIYQEQSNLMFFSPDHERIKCRVAKQGDDAALCKLRVKPGTYFLHAYSRMGHILSFKYNRRPKRRR